MVRRWVAALAGLLIAFALSAQNHKITLQLQDATTAEPVGFATVSLTPEKGQAKYTLSDGDGHALLEKVKSGKYTLKAEIMGYKPFSQLVEVKEALDLGVIKMELDQQNGGVWILKKRDKDPLMFLYSDGQLLIYEAD